MCVPPKPAQTFTRAQVFVAMCLMEEVAEPVLSDAGAPWQEFRERHGVAELREALIDLVPAVDAAWARAYAAYEASHPDDPAAPQDPGSFDYEFVPFWLRAAVDWSDVEAGPRVRGSTAP